MISGPKAIAVGLIIFPAALGLWSVNTLASSLFGVQMLTTTRWLSALLVPIIFMGWGMKRKSLSPSGAITGYFVGFIMILANWCFLGCLAAFFVSSSKATKYKSSKKKKFEADFKEGGQRNWVQVLSNSLVASFISLLYIIDCGSGEALFDLHRNYRCSLLSVAFLGALSCSNGDTWASELGPAFYEGSPYLITTWKKVPTGTNGGVSRAGVLFSFLGGLVIGLSYYLFVMALNSAAIDRIPPQWPLILLGAFGGLLGSLVDSLLGATLQYSGITKDGRIVQQGGEGIKHVSGMQILDNHAVNLLSTLITAILVPYLSLYVF